MEPGISGAVAFEGPAPQRVVVCGLHDMYAAAVIQGLLASEGIDPREAAVLTFDYVEALLNERSKRRLEKKRQRDERAGLPQED